MLTKFCLVLSSMIQFYLVLPSFTEFSFEHYLLSLGFDESYQGLPSSPGFYRVLLGSIDFNKILPSFIKYYSVLLRCTEFYLVLP